MASFSSSQATQPFSDVSQPGADLEQLISTLPSTSDLDFVRIFARCCLQKRLLFVSTYPGGAPAAVLDHDILGVSQSPRAIGCDVQIPSLNEEILRTHLRLYFHPAKDSITVRNMATTEAVALQSSSLSATSKQLMPGNSIDLAPGAWAIETWSPAEVPRPKIRLADLYLLPRQSATSPVNTTAAEGAGSKRRPEESAASSKKQKAATGSLAMPPSGTVSHPLLALSNGETVRVAGRDPKNNYQLTRERLVATTRSAVLYAARHSRRPGQLVLTKALKIGPSARHAAENWRREVSVHEGVGSHPSIASLFGSDARYFTLYMELIDAPSLSEYRDSSNKFTCPDAAFTILSDLTSAIQFVHAAGLVHNDIKPGNAIYHNTRGAILIDFGLGGPGAATSDGGTPWYLPPEYLARRKRGPPSDVFALGVTLLWVLQKCALPDTLKVWQISDIHHGPEEGRARAQHAMRTWLTQVEDLRATLSTSERSLESVVSRMLRRGERATAADITRHLQAVVL